MVSRATRLGTCEGLSMAAEIEEIMDGDFSIPLPVLDGKNWEKWCVQMRSIFGFQDVLEVVQNGYPALGENPSDAQRNAHKEATRKDHKAMFFLHQCVDAAHFEKISMAKSAKDAWATLEKCQAGGGKLKKVKLQTLRKQYELLQMEKLSSNEEEQKQENAYEPMVNGEKERSDDDLETNKIKKESRDDDLEVNKNQKGGATMSDKDSNNEAEKSVQKEKEKMLALAPNEKPLTGKELCKRRARSAVLDDGDARGGKGVENTKGGSEEYDVMFSGSFHQTLCEHSLSQSKDSVKKGGQEEAEYEVQSEGFKQPSKEPPPLPSLTERQATKVVLLEEVMAEREENPVWEAMPRCGQNVTDLQLKTEDRTERFGPGSVTISPEPPWMCKDELCYNKEDELQLWLTIVSEEKCVEAFSGLLPWLYEEEVRHNNKEDLQIRPPSSEPPNRDSRMVANEAKAAEKGSNTPERSRGVSVAIRKLGTKFRSCISFEKQNAVKKNRKGEDEVLCLWRRKKLQELKYNLRLKIFINYCCSLVVKRCYVIQ